MVKNQKIVLVTGAASGIGLAITKYLALKGMHVIASDINKEQLNNLLNLDNIEPVYLDVTKIDTMQNVVSKIEERHKRLDGLVNNAGIFVGGPLVEVPEKDFEKIININLFGPYKVTKTFFPLLLKSKGRIINIGSESGRISFPMNGPYSMSKYALEAFSDALRRELMFLDMKVIHLQVGSMQTALLKSTYNQYTKNMDGEKTMFKKLYNKVIKTVEKEKVSSAKPIYVAKVVYKALSARNPKARVKIKNNKMRRFLEFLPYQLVDFGVKRFVK